MTDTKRPLPLLGGLSPDAFMRRHWQKRPLLVRGAFPAFQPLLDRQELFALAREEGVESRVVQHAQARWQVRHGPVKRLPPVARREWTLLVQGVDLHHAGAHALLQAFSFIPSARLDDLMISWASDGGGVGPHFDSYDVFLLQAQGQRRWRIGRQRALELRADAPLRILARFEPEEEHLLEPGDMLYLPPGHAHDGVAQGECQTYSIGFRAPARDELARELLQRIADGEEEGARRLYADPRQPATDAPGAIPAALQEFARAAVTAALRQPDAIARALGEYLTEPKPGVWFETAGRLPRRLGGVVLDARTRMLHDSRHVFVNGESWRAAGRDAALMRRLADQRRLEAADLARASDAAHALLLGWCEAGWAHPQEGKP